MSQLGPGLARSHRILLSRLLWPTGMLFVSTLLMVGSTFWWTSRNADLVAVEGQRERLKAAIQERLDSLDDRLGDYVETLADRAREESPRRSDWLRIALERPVGLGAGTLLSSQLEDGEGFEGGLPDPIGIARLRGALAHLVGQMRAGREVASDGSERHVRPRLVSDGERHHAVLALPMRDAPAALRPLASPSDVILGWARLDDGALAQIAELHGLRDLALAPAGASGESPSLPLRDARGGVVAQLSWNADAPGHLTQHRLLPMMAGGVLVSALLFGAVGIHFHRTTRNLAETDALTKELLGRDPLSGLPNRLLFNERLDHELARLALGTGGLAVMFIDLDRFKNVNDAHGHQAGDHLIRLVAERLTATVSARDTLARFGGDEFAVIQTGIAAAADAGALTRRILDVLTEPFTLADSQVAIGASIGVALAPDHAGDRHTLMRLADTALYQAKNEGRNRTSFFQARMDETLKMRKLVEDDLRHAIQTDQLTLAYQPLYSCDGETIVGLEALVRWQHATRGMISPGEFVPIAEERGLVIPLGEWVLRRACLDARRWPGIRVAVNVSAIQFRHRNYVAGVVQVLAETGFDPTLLELELTEGVVVADADAAEAAMIELRALGVHLALDDFGTGYSSLIYLRRFAFDTIKIDRSFLESMEATGESAILVHSIVHLGRALGLTVTAEGVETREQHRFLQALGCHQLQGFLFSPPVPACEIDRLLGLAAPGSVAPGFIEPGLAQPALAADAA